MSETLLTLAGPHPSALATRKPTTPPPILLESIRIEDGRVELLEYHQDRVDRALRRYFPRAGRLWLDRAIETLELPPSGIHKLRLQYRDEILHAEIQPYIQRRIESLRIVAANDLDYGHKYLERQAIDRLFQQRGACDDVLFSRMGYLTDTSYANVAFFNGSEWITPAWPLLRGCRREFLLANKIIVPSILRERDLPHFSELKVFNSMIPWTMAPRIPLERVVG